MDTTPTTSSSSGQPARSVSAFFEASRKADASAKALADAGFNAEEILQTEQNGGYLVTVENTSRASDAATILKQHNGSLSGDFSGLSGVVGAGASPVDDGDTESSGDRSQPTDSGLSDPATDRPAGGRTYTSGSSAGGSGSGTASGGSLFGSSR